VLFPPEPIDGPEALDPVRYGVIVSRGGRRGLLLPNLDGVNTVGSRSASPGEGRHRPGRAHPLHRFEVERHE
jgi:hypothetical protein